jgi:hypothetical protein
MAVKAGILWRQSTTLVWASLRPAFHLNDLRKKASTKDRASYNPWAMEVDFCLRNQMQLDMDVNRSVFFAGS